MCYYFEGEYKYKDAEQKCKDIGGQVPVPRSDKERDDFIATVDVYLAALKKLGFKLHIRTAINSVSSLKTYKGGSVFLQKSPVLHFR